MFIKPLKQMICVGHPLWPPNTLTLPFGDQIFFSIIMFVTLVVDNVVTLVGDKIVTVVIDFEKNRNPDSKLPFHDLTLN